jgi:hypothetical protein
MSDVKGDEFKKRESAVLDPRAEMFAQAFSGEFGCEKYEFGAHKRLKCGLSDLSDTSFLETIRAIDRKVGQTFDNLAYSFCVRFESRAEIGFWQRSVGI